MSPNGITKVPPISYPTVVIDGQSLSFKVDNLAIVLLDSWGVDVEQVGPQLRQKIGRIALSWKLFAAMVAHNFVKVGKPIPTWEEWAARIAIGDTKEIFAAVQEAMVKAAPPAVTNPAAAAEVGEADAPAVQ
jgi:hypothetical protein